MCDSFVKVAKVTVFPDFSHPFSFVTLHTVLISLKGPDSPFVYEPWSKEPTFLGLSKKIFSHTLKQSSDESGNATRKCSPQKY